ncbi:MAG: tRNA lysidine(34) synthetase TilS [Candidatus Manganitrophaceae bacterium]
MISLRKDRSLIERFSESLRSFSIRRGDKFIVAVSGGPDSVCLLYLLKQLSNDLGYSLHVAHLNHGFRPEAAEEAAFVETLCNTWELPVTLSSLPVPQICKERRLSAQEGAREVRYAFLKKIAQEAGAQWIAVGHTADDQAETFLMRLLRGGGSRGLGAIPRMREGKIIRPLLSMTRKEILHLLSEAGVPFRKDPSNEKETYLRNRIRRRLLPLLEEYTPRIRETLVKEASLLAEENDFLEKHLEEWLPRLGIKVEDKTVRIDLESLQSLHPALQRRALRWGIERLYPGLKGIGFGHIEKIRSTVLPGPTGRRIDLPRRLQATRTDSELVIRKTFEHNPRKIGLEKPFLPNEASFFPSPHPIDLPDWGLRIITSILSQPAGAFSPCTATFDFDKISLPLSIRGWRQGDRFVPIGMRGKHKKLQDLFVDAKIPKDRRTSIPILTSRIGILWIIGLRTDHRFQVTEKTKQVLAVTIQPLRSPVLGTPISATFS